MVKGGVRQGDPLSSLLFNLLLEKIIPETDRNRSGLIYHKKHQCLAFADDIVIVTRNRDELKKVTKRLEAKAREKRIYINEAKTKYMEWANK